MRWILVCICMIIFTACSNRNSVPKGIIGPDAMRSIMKDVIVADAYSTQYIPRDTAKHDKLKANQDLLEAIFKIHHTNREEFKKSLAFYESRPDLSKNMFDSLAAYASFHHNELYRPVTNIPTPGKPPVHPIPGPMIHPALRPGLKSHAIQIK